MFGSDRIAIGIKPSDGNYVFLKENPVHGKHLAGVQACSGMGYVPRDRYLPTARNQFPGPRIPNVWYSALIFNGYGY